MKLLLVFAGLLVATNASAIPLSRGTGRSVIDDQIIKILNCIKDQMPNGVLGSPPLDPFSLNRIEVSNEGPLTIDGYIENISVTGLSAFEINKIKLNMLTMSMTYDFTFKGVQIEGFYDVFGTAGGFLPIFGKGPFTVQVDNVRISGAIKLRLKGLHLELSTIGLKFDIGSLFVNIEGLLGGGDLSILLNRVINDLLPELLVQNSQQISSGADVLVKGIVNPILNGMTFSDLIDMISGGGGEGGICPVEEKKLYKKLL